MRSPGKRAAVPRLHFRTSSTATVRGYAARPLATTTVANPPWAELVQLVPIVTLALPFIIAGKIDFERAGTALLLAALLTLPVSAFVLAKGCVLNPILVGTALWLWLAAVAFRAPLPGLVAVLSDAQGAGLFAGVLAIGLVSTFASPQGFVGCRHPNRAWLARASLLLLLLSTLALGWSWAFRQNIRLGGGLPFIVLNVARRMLVLRAPKPV